MLWSKFNNTKACTKLFKVLYRMFLQWNLLVLTFSKHPLNVQFDQALAEIFEVKYTWYVTRFSIISKQATATGKVRYQEGPCNFSYLNPLSDGGRHWMPPPSQNSSCASGSDFFDNIFWWQFLSIHILLDSFPSKAKIRLKKVLQV